jgi:hypothetical protein
MSIYVVSAVAAMQKHYLIISFELLPQERQFILTPDAM